MHKWLTANYTVLEWQVYFTAVTQKLDNYYGPIGNGGPGNSTNAGFNGGDGDYPTYITAIANGIVYTETTEHTILNPVFKGCLARAINATDGKELWTLSSYTGGGGSTTSYAVADGFSTWFNGYDNSIYVVGRGPSQTTVDAPKAGISLGNSVVISGTVLDIAAGTQQTQQTAKFPNGVPVSSDASMSDWMAYVYQQKPMPTTFAGVQVQLYVLDTNGNYRQIGAAPTDENGYYTLSWKPDIEGDYRVYAQFAGNNGYWPSKAVTSFTVEPQTATTPPTATPQTDIATTGELMTTMSIGVIAIIIAIAIVGVLLLRKKP